MSQSRRGFIDQNPDPMPIHERHDVDGLSRAPKGHDAVSSAKGMVVTTMSALRQSRRTADHEAGQQRAEQAFSYDREQGIPDVRRLVKS